MTMDSRPTAVHTIENTPPPPQEQEHPFMVGEQLGVLKINNPGSVFDGMEIPIPRQRRELSRNVSEALLSEMQNPVQQLLQLVENVTNQSFAQGAKTYQGENRKILIHKILENLSDSPKYRKLLEKFASGSSEFSKIVINATVYMLSNTNYLKAIIGFVVDGWDSSRAPRRIQDFEDAMREASWQVQQERDPGFYQQTQAGHFSVQTVLNPAVAYDLFSFYQLTQQTETVGLVPTESFESDHPKQIRPGQDEEEYKKEQLAHLERLEAEKAARDAAAARPLARIKKKLQEAANTFSDQQKEFPEEPVRQVTSEEFEAKAAERQLFANTEKLNRLEKDFRSAVVGVTIANKIELMREAAEFLETDYGEEKATLTRYERLTKKLKAKLSGRHFSPESAEAFLRLQEVYKFDPNSEAVNRLLDQEFGLDQAEITALNSTRNGRKDLEKLIRRARAIVTHGFTRDTQHGIAEVTFGKEPRHFVILVHGAPYKIEYYNKDGFITQELLIRAVQNLEYTHADQSKDPEVLKQRQVIASIWTELSYNPKKNEIVTDPLLLDQFIKKFLRSDLKNTSQVTLQIADSIRALISADFSVSVGADEVPAFGADDQAGEMLSLVFGGQHIDISDNIGAFCQQFLDSDEMNNKRTLSNIANFFEKDSWATQLLIKINSQFDHGLTDGREAQETNAELLLRLSQYLVSVGNVAASRKILPEALLAQSLSLGVIDGEMVFDDEKVIAENVHEYSYSLPDLPEALVNSPKALTKELDKSVTITMENELKDRLEAIDSMSLRELFDGAGTMVDRFVNVTVDVQMNAIREPAWQEHLRLNPDIPSKSPRKIQVIKDTFYIDLETGLRDTVKIFLNGDHELMKEVQEKLQLKKYDFSAAARLYGVADVSKISAVEYSRFMADRTTLAGESDTFNILAQYEQINTVARKVKRRLTAIQKQKKEAEHTRDTISDVLDIKTVYDETYARLNSTEEQDLLQLLDEMNAALKQINLVLTRCLYDKELFATDASGSVRESDPIIAQVHNLQLNRISSVTAIHYAQLMADMMNMMSDDMRPALRRLPTSRNIAEIPTSRLDFHTMTGYAETMLSMQSFAEIWADTNKDRTDGKAQVLEAFKDIIQDFVVNYSMQFQIGVDQARKQVSDTSVLSAGTNRFTQWLLEVSLQYTGLTGVLAQQRTGNMISVVDSNPGVAGGYSLLSLSEGEMSEAEHLTAVLNSSHGQDSFHTAGSKNVGTAMGVTRVHDGENSHYAFKGRKAVTDQHLDQIAMAMLGVERNVARELVEGIKPGYYFNQLTVPQRREALHTAKSELVEQTKSMYYWYFFINVITKMDMNQVGTRYDEWVVSESSLSFIKYVMEQELPKYNLSEEAMDFYQNGPRLNA